MAYSRVSLADLKLRLAERWEAKPFWTATDAKDAINESLRVFNAMTGFWKTRTTTTTVPHDAYVQLTNGGITFRARVEFNSKPLLYSSLEDMNNGYPHWRYQHTQTGGNVPTRPAFWIPLSLNLIAIWPADAVGNNIITVDGVCTTPVLVNDGDFIDIGEEFHNALLDYALSVASFKVGGPMFESLQRGHQALLTLAGEHLGQLHGSSPFKSAQGVDRQPKEAPITVGRG